VQHDTTEVTPEYRRKLLVIDTDIEVATLTRDPGLGEPLLPVGCQGTGPTGWRRRCSQRSKLECFELMEAKRAKLSRPGPHGFREPPGPGNMPGAGAVS